MATSEIEFFGKVDRDSKGKIISQTPAWAMHTHIDELKEGIASKRRSIDRGLIDDAQVPYLKNEILREEGKLRSIEESRPKLTAKDTDSIHKSYEGLGSAIKETLFSRDEMMKGLADAGEEARRMVNPIIKVDPKLAESCGVKTYRGKVSRNGASKMFQILGKTLGEPTNIEYLRPDRRR